MYKLGDAKIDPHAGVRTLNTAVMSLNPTNRENGNMEKDILCRSEVATHHQSILCDDRHNPSDNLKKGSRHLKDVLYILQIFQRIFKCLFPFDKRFFIVFEVLEDAG